MSYVTRQTYKQSNFKITSYLSPLYKSQEECDSLIEEMAKESGLTEYGKLYSTVEFKKQRLVYFDDVFKAWEANIA